MAGPPNRQPASPENLPLGRLRSMPKRCWNYSNVAGVRETRLSPCLSYASPRERGESRVLLPAFALLHGLFARRLFGECFLRGLFRGRLLRGSLCRSFLSRSFLSGSFL